MSVAAVNSARRLRSILAGAVIVGVLDGLDALVFFGLRGVAGTILLGVALHFVVAFLIVLTCVVLSGWLPVITRRPFLAGSAYGVFAYVVMNHVVIPLSAVARGGPPPWPVLINGLLIHIAGVGIPSALVARRARAPICAP